jgi:Mg-chelatase subunit ChlD
MTNTAIVVGSLADVASREKTSVAESFVNAECVVIVDLSGSMQAKDSRDRQQRYLVAFQELERLQHDLPGKIAVIGFADTAQFFPGGKPVMGLCGGSTNLAGALDFARMADAPGIRFVVISDGEPNDREAALKAARKFKGKIDVIFVGPSDRPHGRKFLEQLAAASGGKTVTADRVKELAKSVHLLLGEG